MRSANDTV